MAPAPERLHFGFWLSNERLTNINMAEQDKKKEPYSWCVSLSTHPQYPHPICMVQILGLKREIRIAFSQNGSIHLLSWNRNVIRNQCIRTGLDILTIQLHTFFLLSLSVSLCLSLSLNKLLALHLHHNHPGVEEEVWIRPKHTIMSAKP